MSDFIRDAKGGLIYDVHGVPVRSAPSHDVSDVQDLAAELVAAKAALEKDVRDRTERQFAVAEQLRGEIAKLKTLQLSLGIDDSSAELISMGAERALNVHEPKDDNGHGAWVGALRRNLHEARRVHEELVRRLEQDIAKLEKPAPPDRWKRERISALESEVERRKDARASRLAELRAELEELGVMEEKQEPAA